ncbi:MAG TPA: hypothetical protein VK821_04415 [Dehalococcoidia bacterium]|nr:hypothetical protein [Dehalococcoidia bacterium]
MRLSMLAFLPLLALAFIAGRTTSLGTASATTASHIYTGRIGDSFRVPAAATRCVASTEGGAADLICAHTPVALARYEVVFYKDNLFVFRNGNPDKPVFSARGKP